MAKEKETKEVKTAETAPLDNYVESLRRKHQTELDALTKDHVVELEAMKQKHAGELDLLKKDLRDAEKRYADLALSASVDIREDALRLLWQAMTVHPRSATAGEIKKMLPRLRAWVGEDRAEELERRWRGL